MKRFGFVTGCLAVFMAASNAGAVDTAIPSAASATVQPVSVASLLGDADHKGGFDAGCDQCDPLWTIYAGAVILKRESPSVLQDFDFDYEVGADINVRRRIGQDWAAELRYFGVDDWDDQQTLGVLPLPELGTVFLGGPGEYSSSLHSTEINLRRDWISDRLTVLAGFRWVELHEEFAASDGLLFLADNVDNHMYGFQLGVDAVVWDRGRFTVNAGAKAGIYYNDADVDGAVIMMGVPSVGTAEDDSTAFLGEMSITGAYELNQNWSVLAGYQLLWIEGVATADRQAGALVTGDLDTSGSPFYHGATLGVQFVY